MDSESTVQTYAGRSLMFLFRGGAGDRSALGAFMAERGWDVRDVPISDFAPVRGVWEVLRRRDFGRYDVVAASEYYLTWAVCLRLLVQPNKPKIVALGFNQSRRVLLTGIRFIDRLTGRVWRRASLFLVHSRAEASLFERTHDIPAGRFVFSHWGYDLPAHDLSKTKVPAEPYVTMIGRNNRDIATFCSAVDRAGVKGVLVTASYMLDRPASKYSNNVQVLTDRPMEECLNYVAGSFAHLVLVQDGTRGAGHISAVSAMHMGKPQIFSDVAPLSDYLINDVNGIAVPLGDVDGVVRAIRRLKDDPELAQRLGRTGKEFASEHMTHASSTRTMADAIEAAAM